MKYRNIDFFVGEGVSPGGRGTQRSLLTRGERSCTGINTGVVTKVLGTVPGLSINTCGVTLGRNKLTAIIYVVVQEIRWVVRNFVIFQKVIKKRFGNDLGTSWKTIALADIVKSRIKRCVRPPLLIQKCANPVLVRAMLPVALRGSVSCSVCCYFAVKSG